MVQAHATDTDINDKVDPGESHVKNWNVVAPERHNLTGFYFVEFDCRMVQV